jgi:hypothetical protein
MFKDTQFDDSDVVDLKSFCADFDRARLVGTYVFRLVAVLLPM